MTLAVDKIHGGGPSDKMRPQLQPKKTKVRLYQPLILQQKVSYALYITNKTGAWSLPSVIYMGVAQLTKKGNWLQPKKIKIRLIIVSIVAKTVSHDAHY